MKIDVLNYDEGSWQTQQKEIDSDKSASVVFIFGDTDAMKEVALYDELKSFYPDAHIVGASSSGNIQGTTISTAKAVATAVYLEKSYIEMSVVDTNQEKSLEALSHDLVNQLPQENLRHIFIMSDGLNVNGSELVRGINDVSGAFTVSGGMAGDGDRFHETLVVADGPPRQKQIVAIGFYGDDVQVSTGCYAGWSAFGADRMVTKSDGNILYELDNRPALDLYKEYLGSYADGLPSTGMRFPLSIREAQESNEVIRTLLAIDVEEKSITFAGDIPEGYIARLMKPNIDDLLQGAGNAAMDIVQAEGQRGLGLTVSCVGRRMVMKELIEEELENVGNVLGDTVELTGFYSYGEISPFKNQLEYCNLHNQTMTLTVLYER